MSRDTGSKRKRVGNHKTLQTVKRNILLRYCSTRQQRNLVSISRTSYPLWLETAERIYDGWTRNFIEDIAEISCSVHTASTNCWYTRPLLSQLTFMVTANDIFGPSPSLQLFTRKGGVFPLYSTGQENSRMCNISVLVLMHLL